MRGGGEEKENYDALWAAFILGKKVGHSGTVCSRTEQQWEFMEHVNQAPLEPGGQRQQNPPGTPSQTAWEHAHSQ